MKTKKRPIDILLGLAVVLALCGVAYGIGLLFQGAPEPGSVTVRSGETRVEAYTCVIGETRKDGSVMDGARIDVQTEAAQFPVLEMAGDLYLTPTQDPLGDAMYYTMYDGDLKELYYRSAYFTYPETPGTYYVVAEASWGRNDHYFTTEHGFAFVMHEPRVHTHE